MQQLKILNSREVKRIKEIVVKDFGGFLNEDYAYLQNEKGKVYVINKDIAKIKLENLKIDKMGLYFAEVKNNQVRLSKEGAQLLNLQNKKLQNIVSLNNNEVKDYFSGKDLDKELGENKLVLLEYEGNILGCAKYKDQKILNFLPKNHRGTVIL
tara:strand:+ start:1130 stop:1591 length:462 start_codon:yes stop_codon:yes gene_type:complete